MGFVVFSAPKVGDSAAPQNKAGDSPMNAGDANNESTSANQQKMGPGDRAIIQKSRAEITNDKSLSTYSHKPEMFPLDGHLNLQGHVRKDDEPFAMEAKTNVIAGDGNVTSRPMTVPPKSLRLNLKINAE